MSRQHLFAAFFFAVFLFLLSQLYALFALFLKPLTWTIILVLTFYPIFEIFLKWFRGRRSLAAFAITFFILLLVMVPLAFLSSLLTSQMFEFYNGMRSAAESGQLQQLLSSWQNTSLGELWQKWAPRIITKFDLDLPRLLLNAANNTSQYIVSHVPDVAKNLLVLLLNVSIVGFSLFFLFRDGEEFLHVFRDLIPMESRHKEAIFHQFYETVSAVVQGMVVTALVQGVLAWIGFIAVGLPYSFFLGCASAVASLQPLGGAAAVWLPAALYLGLSGSWSWATALIIYGVVIISGIDNIIKPLIIGERTKLPTLFLFFGILGGLQAYGFLGVFLGPVVLATIMAFVKIYRETYAHVDEEPLQHSSLVLTSSDPRPRLENKNPSQENITL
jgi:predicted PurR-regulated permease PerM